MRTLVFSAMKDEGPDVLEWAAYHRVIGFDDILVVTNDCTDGSDLLLDALQGIGWLFHRRHRPPPGVPAQQAAAPLIHADPVYRAADWAIWIDADEYTVFATDEGTPRSAIGSLPRPHAIAMTWMNFGSAGRHLPPDGLVIEDLRLTMARPDRMSRTFKCLHRVSDDIVSLFPHRPIWRDGARVRFFDQHGAWMGNKVGFRVKPNGRPDEMVYPKLIGHGRFRINHYPIKSHLLHQLKRARGDGNGNRRRLDDSYFRRFDHNEVEDLTIQRHASATRAMMAVALADPAVGEAYAIAQEHRRARLAAVTADRAAPAATAREQHGHGS